MSAGGLLVFTPDSLLARDRTAPGGPVRRKGRPGTPSREKGRCGQNPQKQRSPAWGPISTSVNEPVFTPPTPALAKMRPSSMAGWSHCAGFLSTYTTLGAWRAGVRDAQVAGRGSGERQSHQDTQDAVTSLQRVLRGPSWLRSFSHFPKVAGPALRPPREAAPEAAITATILPQRKYCPPPRSIWKRSRLGTG